jgi:translation initiation factor 2B subunit (eIF-2B alpha/beta/delta family)
MDAREAVALTTERVHLYDAYSRRSLTSIVDTACALLPARGHILIHDYSSTVLAITDGAGRQGRTLTVYVTAGEPVGKGPTVARAVADAGHHVVYLPDVSIGRVMGEIDLVLSGVETLFRNGDLANTVGTYPIALTAREAKVPVYAVTERMKIHPEARAATVSELDARVLHSWPDVDQTLPAGTDVRLEVLDLTPACLVTGYVTEEGVLTSTEVDGAMERLYKELAQPMP